MPAEPYIGEITIYPYTFAPNGWAYCQGQILQVIQYQALFSLLGATFGGNGQTTFALPDLRGRTPVGTGTGPGLTPIVQGQTGGVETINKVAAHTHTAVLHGESTLGNSRDPLGRMLATPNDSNLLIFAAPVPADNKAMAADSIVVQAAGDASVPVRNPFLGLNYCIALQGLYPERP